MNDTQKAALLEKILLDKNTQAAFENSSTLEEMQNYFAANGLDLSMAEMEEFQRAARSATSTDDELMPDELAVVTGGAVSAFWVFKTSFKIIKKVAKSAWNVGKWLADRV